MLGQTGAVEAGHAGPSKLYERDRLGIILHDVMFAPFFAGAAGPGEIWHWYSYVDKHDLWYHFGRFADLIQGLDPPAEGFVPGKIEHPRLRVCMLRGRKTFLAWCRDNNDDWRSELQEGKEPRVIGGAVLDFSQLEAGAPVGSWRVYNPWSGQWYPAKIRDGKLALPKFLRSIVVRVDG